MLPALLPEKSVIAFVDQQKQARAALWVKKTLKQDTV
jgi:hypothetical protein